MKEIPELKLLFDEINKLKNRASINKSQFCTELTNSDNDEYLELHFQLLEQKKKYFQSDLKMFFGFRQNKEKAHYFLKNKLQHLTDEQLINDVEEIINDIKFYTLEEYTEWLKNIKEGKRNDKNQFVWAIMKSPYVEFHYQLLNDKELDDEFKRHLRNRFEEHEEKAENLLLSKLENDEDVNFKAEIIFILGCIAEKGANKDKALYFARQLTKSLDDYTRERALIVLGWVGSIDDTDILEKHLLYDTSPNCRAWSASSFMQMYLRKKTENLKQKSFKAFLKSLHQETNYFTLSIVLSSLKEISNSKFGISETALDELDIEKIDIAKEKGIKYLLKVIKQN